MSNTWLALDVSYLAWRNFHILGDLAFDGEATGVLFGLFRDILNFQELHQPDGIAFCFDAGHDKRSELYPQYKADRRERPIPDDEREARRTLRRQLYRFRTRHLPSIGYRNILWAEGYEADDWMAKVCEDKPKGDIVVVVTSDADLFQVLAHENVTIWNPRSKQAINRDSFQRERGIDPSLWADVKAIAGCDGDNVKGVKGVGEKTAVKFLTGRLKAESKSHQSIVRNNERWERNLPLVRLPFPGLPRVKMKRDDVGPAGWDRVMEQLGMNTLVGRR